MSSIVPIDYGPNANAVGRLGTIIVYPIEGLIYEVTITAQNACPCCCRFCCGRYPDGSVPSELYLTITNLQKFPSSISPLNNTSGELYFEYKFATCPCMPINISYKMTRYNETNPYALGFYTGNYSAAKWAYIDPLFPLSKRIIKRPSQFNRRLVYEIPDYDTSGIFNCYIRISYFENDIDPLHRNALDKYLVKRSTFNGFATDGITIYTYNSDIYKMPASVDVFYHCNPRSVQYCDLPNNNKDGGYVYFIAYLPFLYFPEPVTAGKAVWGIGAFRMDNGSPNIIPHTSISCDPYYQKGNFPFDSFVGRDGEQDSSPFISGRAPDIEWGFFSNSASLNGEDYVDPSTGSFVTCGPRGLSYPYYSNREFNAEWTVTE